ncbi:MAG: pyridoxal-phosphate dependent enzyme [Chitinophagaceae bacterium]|nr:pyridoxal-phosphate dependent enzyme [Chitinophagaceae bacterium]
MILSDNEIDEKKVLTQPLDVKAFNHAGIEADLLRLDLIHPVISGNKWFKLKYYLTDAVNNNAKHITTAGGAYSNHIVASAYACKLYGLACTGIIRGEKPTALSPTLIAAEKYGMQLQFISREKYSLKEYPEIEGSYFIEEGGYGQPGAKGAGEITALTKSFASYSHIICAVGTGTMLAGIIMKTDQSQQTEGISVMKNNFGLEEKVRNLLPEEYSSKKIIIHHDYHFGGYAKHPPELVSYMNQFYIETGIPTDVIYTSKMIYAVNDLAKRGYYPKGSRLLLIHSGGLQGNLSLPAGSLSF